MQATILTGGGDKPYALGLAAALSAEGMLLEVVGSDDLSVPELLNNPRVSFLNLRGDQRQEASGMSKALRVLKYYATLICYSAGARPTVFHILWNNKFQLFDCTLLMLYYKLLGKKVTFTAHNVNAGKRDLNDTWLNRFSLRTQYALADHIFVHTEAMRAELMSDFGISERKLSVIPFGINTTVPNTSLSTAEAKQRLGVSSDEKVMLFFGNIAPYKGLEYLVAAFTEVSKKDRDYRLIIAGRPKGGEGYWRQIQQRIERSGVHEQIIERIEYIPDEQTEIYFKAADVLILPYTHIFQSGVLFLGYGFGLPAIAANVATMKEEIIEGETGFVFRAQDSSDLAKTLETFFSSKLFSQLESRRPQIREYARERYSWSKVAAITMRVYSNLLS